MEALHTAIAILGVILLIIGFKVDPVISLVLGSLYLGLAAGLGFENTVGTIADGFGSIMTEVGLLIGFGVLLGALLFRLGALQRLVALLLRSLGARRLPYALSAVLTTIFPSIYVDVQLVLASPLARSAAPQLGRKGLGMMSGALTAGILVGYVFVVPGLGTVAIAGLMHVPLGTMLLYGLIVGPVTAVVTTLIWGLLVRAGFWKPDRDEEESEALRAEESMSVEQGGSAGIEEDERLPSLGVALLPIVVPLLLIATGAIATAVGVESSVLGFFGDPNLALFVGLVGAYLLARRSIGNEQTEAALSKGFNTTGQILLITGVGGSLGAVIEKIGLDKVLGGLFSAESGTPVLLTLFLAWFVAALLHLAIGSISVAAITAAGIISPIMGGIDVAPVVVGLAIGAGALFALQVNSNFFWMFQTLLGVSTQGALKALTFVTALASTVSMPIITALAFVV
ncbi:MAG TPA: hypothetical protein VF049_01215 [Nocardioidaceae bacterium]